MGVLWQEPDQQQRQDVAAGADAEHQFGGGEIGRGGGRSDAGEEHGAEGGDTDGVGELLGGVEHARAGADLLSGGLAEDEVEQGG